MSDSQFLFDSSGNWIAFRLDQFVWDADMNWIGWLPWDDGHIVSVRGDYIGDIHPGDRLFRNSYSPYRGYPGYPGFVGYSGLPSGCSDVNLKQFRT